ncbi:MAG: ArgE/DapE family deacylase [Planctomycetota bacterium]|nr:ArgE/DapE family deacylase [Planctomycetota bacterium]
MARRPPKVLAHAAHAWLDAHQKDLLAFTTAFCAIDTTNPPGRNYRACVEFLAEKLRELGLRPKVLRVPPREQAKYVPGLDDHPRYNVVARWDHGSKRTLLLTGHYDVVPATAGWKTDPFKPVRKGARLIGRGTSDMKGCNAAAIFAVQALLESGQRPPWNVELAFTADEETGGYAGLGHLVRAKRLRADAAVLLEGGGGQNVGIAHRGVLWLDVTVHGKPGHASNPRNGINALEKAIGLIGELRKLERRFPARRSRFVAPAMSRRATQMIGGVSGGGGKVNTIPDRFRFSIDRRLIPEEKVEAVKREYVAAVREAMRRDRDLKATVEFPLYVESGHTRPEQPICRAACEAVKAVHAKRPRLRMTGGFTDMHFLTNDGGIPAIGYGAGGGGAHGDFEYLNLPDQLVTAKVYAEIAMRMGKGQ